jgi:serine/threonine protein kinase
MTMLKIFHIVFGLGVINLPSSFAQFEVGYAGVYIGMFVVVIGAVYTNYLSRNIAIMMHSRKVCGYDQLAMYILPDKPYIFIVIKIFLMMSEFSLAYSYMTGAADLFTRAVFSSDFDDGQVVKPPAYYGSLVIVNLGVLPLLFEDNFFASFDRTIIVSNIVALVLIFWIIISTAMAIDDGVSEPGPDPEKTSDPEDYYEWDGVRNAFRTVPAVAFFLALDQTSFFIYLSIDKAQQSHEMWDRINHNAFFFATILGITLGAVGSIAVNRGEAPGLILIGGPVSVDRNAISWESRIATLAYSLILVTTSPPAFLILRDQLMGLVSPKERFDPWRMERRGGGGGEQRRQKTTAPASYDCDVLGRTRRNTERDVVNNSASGGILNSVQLACGSGEDPATDIDRKNSFYVTIFVWLVVFVVSMASTFTLDRISAACATTFTWIVGFFVIGCKIYLNYNGQKVDYNYEYDDDNDDDDFYVEDSEGCHLNGGPEENPAWNEKGAGNTASCGELCRLFWSYSCEFLWLSSDSKASPRVAFQDLAIMFIGAVLLLGYFVSYVSDPEPNKTLAELGMVSVGFFLIFSGVLLFALSECGKALPEVAGPASESESERGSSIADLERLLVPHSLASESTLSSEMEGNRSNQDWEIRREDLTELNYVNEGGFGAIYKYKYLGNVVAVKKSRRRQKGAAVKISQHVSEIKKLMILHHPNIVRMFGICHPSPDEDPWIVMEFVDDTLESAVETDQYSPEHFWRWSVSIASTMQHLDSMRIMHRDLKPNNILIAHFDLPASRTNIKLCDFGFARFQSDRTTQMTMGGTPAYMAPELYKPGKPGATQAKYNSKLDVYSFAMVLYFMWARRPPFADVEAFHLPILVAERGERPNTSCLFASGGSSNGSGLKGRPCDTTASSSSKSSKDTQEIGREEQSVEKTSSGKSHQSSASFEDQKNPHKRANLGLELCHEKPPTALSLTHRGKQLGRPVLKLVKRCWNKDARKRPAFEEIAKTLESLAPEEYMLCESKGTAPAGGCCGGVDDKRARNGECVVYPGESYASSDDVSNSTEYFDALVQKGSRQKSRPSNEDALLSAEYFDTVAAGSEDKIHSFTLENTST